MLSNRKLIRAREKRISNMYQFRYNNLFLICRPKPLGSMNNKSYCVRGIRRAFELYFMNIGNEKYPIALNMI